jgi:hypothetical protein
VSGAAQQLATELTTWGYHARDAGNAPAFTHTTSRIYYRPAASTAANDLRRIVGAGTTGRMPASIDKTTSAPIVIVTGKSLPHRLAITPPHNRPGAALPQTITRTPMYRSMFAPARRQLGFTIMYPAVSQTDSTLCPWVPHPLGYGQASCQGTPSTPVRKYRIPAAGGSGPNSLYAVFYDANTNGYWGIEETRYTAAPLLATPNARRHIDGRTYLFFFNGSHIQTIAFIQNGAAYWVENTLLDDLTNREMIAIAGSLRPT